MYAWCLERINPEKVEEWIHGLHAPLPGREAEPTESELEKDGESFMAAMATFQASKGA